MKEEDLNAILQLLRSADESAKRLGWTLLKNAETLPQGDFPLYQFLSHYSQHKQMIADNFWALIRAHGFLSLRFGLEYTVHLGNRDWLQQTHYFPYEQRKQVENNAVYIRKLKIQSSEDGLPLLNWQRFSGVVGLELANGLCHLPAELRFFRRLESLNLSNNKLNERHFSDRVAANWENLRWVDLSKNRFSEFPPALLKLANLEYINLSDNLYGKIKPPQALGSHLPNLRELIL